MGHWSTRVDPPPLSFCPCGCGAVERDCEYQEYLDSLNDPLPGPGPFEPVPNEPEAP